MKQLTCEMCNGTELLKQDGVFVCQHCGTKYSVEEAKKMMIDGTVDVSGSTIKVDSSDELANLYKIARRAKDDNNSENAAKYYDMILVKDPNSWEASFYLVYFKAMQCKLGQIQSAGYSIANCINTVMKLIKENVTDKNEQIKALCDVILYCNKAANTLFSAAVGHFNGISSSIQYKYKGELENNCLAAITILYCVGDSTIALFNEYKELHSTVASTWKCAINLHMKLLTVTNNKENIKSKVLSYATKIQKIDPSYTAPKFDSSNATSSSSSGGGCYVATAVYGSYDCPQVWTLRRFRDNTLAKTWYGRMFIRAYYGVSPTLVKWFGNTDWFKKMWRNKLDHMVSKLNGVGVEDTPYQDRAW